MKCTVGIIFAAVMAGVAAGQQFPLLEQLDRETQGLYQEVQQSVVRVQLPPPAWVEELLADEHPAAKWKELDPDVREKLEQSPAGKGRDRLNTSILPSSTQPAQSSDAGNNMDAPGAAGDGNWQIAEADDERSVRIESLQRGDRQVIVVAPSRQGDRRTAVRVEARAQGGMAPANLAVIVDGHGHLVVPVYLERGQFSRAVPVQLAGGQSGWATFVGSDRQTNLTVLKLDHPAGRAARMRTGGQPDAGSLVMILSPANDTARLAVWTDGGREWGVVVSADGGIAGFARHGQFLAGSAVAPVVEQLIAHGSVSRPQLGLVVVEIGPDDPLRQQRSLGDQPALHVRRVIPGSPADQADMRADDVILRLGETPVGDIPTFAAILIGYPEVAPLTVRRDGADQVVAVRLGR